MRYAIVTEEAQGNFSAYVPDLPGRVATGATIDEIELQIREATEFHLDSMREDGTSIPQPAASSTWTLRHSLSSKLVNAQAPRDLTPALVFDAQNRHRQSALFQMRRLEAGSNCQVRVRIHAGERYEKLTGPPSKLKLNFGL